MSVPRQPPYVICYLCGRKYGTKSIVIHGPHCIKKWHAENKKLPKHLRRKLPTKPDYSLLTNGDYNEQMLDQMNEMSFKASQEQLIPCGNCGRTFLPDRLQVHQRSCTVHKPDTSRPRTVTKSRTAANIDLSGSTQNIQEQYTRTTQDIKPSNRSNMKNSSNSASNQNSILCGLCQKQIPIADIQRHLVRCNEEKTQHLKRETFTMEVSDFPDSSNDRPNTRTLHRGPLKLTKDAPEEKSYPDIKYDTYDIDSPDEEPAKGSSRLSRKSQVNYDKDMCSEFINDDSNLVKCDLCNRKFASERIAKHKTICNKTTSKHRIFFDSSKQRLQGTEAVQHYRKNPHKQQQAAPKSNWRQTHQDFIRSIRAAKQVTVHMAKGGKASDLPPPPPSLNPDYVHCQYCDRRFNPDVAERHIPKCASILNRPKPPKQKALDTYKTPVTKGRQENIQRKPGNASYGRAPSRQAKREPSFEHFRSTPSRSSGNSGGSTSSGYASPRVQNRFDAFEPYNTKTNQNKPFSKRGSKTSSQGRQNEHDPYKSKFFTGASFTKPTTRGYSYNSMNQTNPANFFGGAYY